MQAAKYLGVAPWELDREPSFWRDAALLCQRIEGEASESRKKK